MKYLINDLYVRCFDGNLFDYNEDKIIIGILNKDGSKLKDVVTGQIVDAVGLYQLVDFRRSEFGGNDMALGCMTGYRASTASLYQKMLAEIIDTYLAGSHKDPGIDIKKIAKVKTILNKLIKNNHLRELELQQKEKKHSVSAEERDF